MPTIYVAESRAEATLRTRSPLNEEASAALPPTEQSAYLIASASTRISGPDSLDFPDALVTRRKSESNSVLVTFLPIALRTPAQIAIRESLRDLYPSCAPRGPAYLTMQADRLFQNRWQFAQSASTRFFAMEVQPWTGVYSFVNCGMAVRVHAARNFVDHSSLPPLGESATQRVAERGRLELGGALIVTMGNSALGFLAKLSKLLFDLQEASPSQVWYRVADLWVRAIKPDEIEQSMFFIIRSDGLYRRREPDTLAHESRIREDGVKVTFTIQIENFRCLDEPRC